MTEAGSPPVAGGTNGAGGKAGGSSSDVGAGGHRAGGGAPDDAGAGQANDGGSGSVAPHFPCDVQAVIEARCQRCHNDPQQNEAPFPLLVWEDTRRQYGEQLVYQAMLLAIETDFMPFTQLELEPPVEPLTPDQKALLLDWLRDDAPASLSAACR